MIFSINSIIIVFTVTGTVEWTQVSNLFFEKKSGFIASSYSPPKNWRRITWQKQLLQQQPGIRWICLWEKNPWKKRKPSSKSSWTIYSIFFPRCFNACHSNRVFKPPKSGWWLNQPLWKIWVKLGSSSPNRGENKKYLKPPPGCFQK